MSIQYIILFVCHQFFKKHHVNINKKVLWFYLLSLIFVFFLQHLNVGMYILWIISNSLTTIRRNRTYFLHISRIETLKKYINEIFIFWSNMYFLSEYTKFKEKCVKQIEIWLDENKWSANSFTNRNHKKVTRFIFIVHSIFSVINIINCFELIILSKNTFGSREESEVAGFFVFPQFSYL